MSDPKDIKKLQDQADKAKVSEITADKIMKGNVITIYEGTKIYVAVQTLALKRISGAPVVNNNDKIIGVVTEYDLLIQTATRDVRDPIQFTKEPVTVTPSTTLKDLIVLFFKTKVRWVPVISKENRILGIVTRVDVLNTLLPSR